MKQLKHALLTVALATGAALFAPTMLLAQGGGPGGPRGGQMGGPRHMPSVTEQLSEMTKRLKLTDAQKPQVKAILEDQHDQMKQLMENSSGSREDNRAKMREIRDNATAKIRDLLTDEQKAKFDKMEEEHRQRRQQRQGGDQGAPQSPPEE